MNVFLLTLTSLIIAVQTDGGNINAMNYEYNEWLRTNAFKMGKFSDDPKEAPFSSFIMAYLKEREGNPPEPR